jgi:hypothetical protein
MKTKILFLCAAVLAANSTFGGLGRPAPAFTAADFDGNQHHLGDYKGKIVVLEAYGSTPLTQRPVSRIPRLPRFHSRSRRSASVFIRAIRG